MEGQTTGPAGMRESSSEVSSGVQNAGQYAAISSRGIRIEAVSQDGDVKTIRLAEQKTAGTVLLQTGRQSRCVWKPSMQ